MKKVVAFILCVLFLFSLSLAEKIDLSGFTDEELVQLIKDARKECFERHLDSSNYQVIYDDNGIKISLTGEHDEYFSSLVHLKCIVENHTDHIVTIFTDSYEINGFQISDTARFVCQDLKPGKKMKDKIILNYSLADLKGYSGLEDILLTLLVSDSETKETLFVTDEMYIAFNN